MFLPDEQGPVRLLGDPSVLEKDDSLLRFHGQLAAAARSRSVTELRPLLADEVVVGVETKLPRDEAIKTFGLSNPNQRWWRLLVGALDLGGTLHRPDVYVLPFFNVSPWVTVREGWCVATRNVVSVRSKPNRNASEVVTLNNDVVQYTPDQSADWLAVRLTDGREGFVEVGDCIGPIDFGLEATKRNGNWRITSLAYGD
jgi:hypothetical protein